MVQTTIIVVKNTTSALFPSFKLLTITGQHPEKRTICDVFVFQGPDLLRPCWDVREDECRSEPGGEPLYDSIGGASSSSMGQRASSTSTLNEPLRRPPIAASAALPPSNKLSLTWALLKKAPLVETSTLIKPDLSPVRPEQVAATQRARTPHIAASRRRSPSSKNSSSRTSSNSASRTLSSSSNSRSSDSLRNFGYDIQDVDGFLSKVSD